MPEFLNPNNYVVHLTGPAGETVQVKPRQRVVLSEFYKKYCPRGFIKEIVQQDQPKVENKGPIQARIDLNRSVVQKRIVSNPAPRVDQQAIERRQKREEAAKTRKIAAAATARTGQRNPQQTVNQRGGKLVGRALNINPNDLLHNNLARNHYPISNNIGIGILSFNRGHCLKRLIDSIITHTDLRRTTVFVSDDASTDQSTCDYLRELSQNQNIVLIRNETRGGIAVNSNRLLRCLSRFEYGILLNDDVEILNQGWEYAYPDVMQRLGMHHLIYRQQGVYKADLGEEVVREPYTLRRVMDKPHGAILAFTNRMLNVVGHFDEAYGMYGMEHVDWSQRAWELGLQEQGFFDVSGSERYFRLHADASVVPDRSSLLHQAREVFGHRKPQRVEESEKSRVPAVSYVVPFRNFERTDSIKTVINNIRAQKFPAIEMIMVEQDTATRIDLQSYGPVKYMLASDQDNPLFNKSKAFNLGVSKSTTGYLILHDADMLAPGIYTSDVMKVLADYESCHLGSTVMYTNEAAMRSINTNCVVDEQSKCDRVVGYYEGGSIACTTKAFWKIGGFNEDFWGYGCEDCDFYARLAGGSRWKEHRYFDFLHLWHSRVSGWNQHHEINKRIEGNLKLKSVAERVALQRVQLSRLGYNKEVEAS